MGDGIPSNSKYTTVGLVPRHVERPVFTDARPLDYHTDRQALSTARYSRAGQSATADTCTIQLTVITR